ncbi:MAG: hypothetical protein EXR69_14995 [Myxococcales bacterium]|nr:hypothetical protein [Myxococcales bacterium]
MRPLPQRVYGRAVTLALTFLSGCNTTEGILLHFDGPIAAAVLSGGTSVFDEPVGLIANQRSGLIVPVDLKAGRLLTLSKSASFLRTPSLPTGSSRLLGDVEVYLGPDGSTTVWATDTGGPSVLRLPWYALDDGGEPVLTPVTTSGRGFVDADASGDDVLVLDVSARDGFATTEDWGISFDGTRWWVEGTASGPQTVEPRVDVPYWTDGGELGFTISGVATAGDRIEIHTETGLVETPVDHPIIDLVVVGDEVWGSYSDETGSGLMGWDATTGDLRRTVRFSSGTGAGRMALGEIAGRAVLFVADTRLPMVHQVDVETAVDDATIPAAAPVVDVAYSAGLDMSGAAYTHLFIAPVGLSRLDVYDPVAGAPVDPNPLTVETDGVPLGSPVSGIAASVGSVWQQKVTSSGARPRVPAIAVATGDGYVFQIDASTGCGVTDFRGAHGPNQLWSSSDGYASIDDIGAASDSAMWIDADSGEQASFSTCGGVTQSETWTITYDSATTSWEVSGSHSGLQEKHAYDDVRYLNDDGAVSFLIVSGALPATDGDQFFLAVSSGLLAIKGVDSNLDGTVDTALQFPGRPTAFQYEVGPTGGGWDEVDRREMMLLPVTDADTAARIELDGGKAEVEWQ